MVGKQKVAFTLLLATSLLTPAAAEEPPVLAFAGIEIADDDAIDLLFVETKQPFYLRMHVRRASDSYYVGWLRHLARLFKQLDRDSDRALSEAEYYRGPWSRLQLGNGEQSTLGFFDLDTRPMDERLSPAEWLGGLGGYSATLKIERDEASGERRASSGVDALLRRLDGDKDGQLSEEECRDAFARLQKYDRNDDELLGKSEIQGDLSDETARNAQASSEDQNREQETVIHRTAGESRDDLAKRLFLHYDLDGDRSLARNEIELADNDFANADADGNQKLSPAEMLIWFHHHKPDAEVDIVFGDDDRAQICRRGANSANDEGAGEAAGGNPVIVQADGSASLQMKWANCQVQLRATPPGDARDIESEAKQRFTSLDVDRNDYLDRDEVGGDSYLFDQADRDQDDKMVLDELVAMSQRQTEQSRAQTGIVIAARGGTLFGLVDVNNDRSLCRRELNNLSARLAEAGLVDGGSLRLGAIPRRYEVTVRSGGLGWTLDALMSASDSANGADAARPGPAKPGPAWFQRMDRNADGDLSRREFLGPRKLFDELDRDRDELIDPGEAAAAQPSESSGSK